MVDMVDIKVGYTCNNDCFHCVIADKRRGLIREGKSTDRTIEEIMDHIKDAINQKAETVVLTGGEITIRREFFQILDFAAKNVSHINLQTNGRMFFYDEYVNKVISYPNVNATIAIHSCKPKVHEWITGAKGSFEQTIQGIKNLIKAGMKNRIGGKIVISKLNMDHISDIVQMCNDIGLKSINIAFPHAMGNAKLNFYDCIPKYSEIADEIIKTTKLSIKLGMHIDWEAIPLCFLKGYETFASELIMVEHAVLKDLTHTDQNYTKARQTTAKRKGPQCKECRCNNICEGVWDDYEEGYDVSELKPYPMKGPNDYIADPREFESFKLRQVPLFKRNINTIVSNKI